LLKISCSSSNSRQLIFCKLDQLGENLANSLVFGFSSEKDIRTGVPNPVTGSHPLVIGKPAVPQLELFPAETSVNPLYPLEYSHGFKKPSGGLPQAIRSSFTREMMLADNGVDADVPEMDEKV
jgi:hypothetical protein